MNIAVVFAGGSGVRMGSGIPKQFLEINGNPETIYQCVRQTDYRLYAAVVPVPR